MTWSAPPEPTKAENVRQHLLTHRVSSRAFETRDAIFAAVRNIWRKLDASLSAIRSRDRPHRPNQLAR
jgi:hypothetical protein